MIIIKNMKMCGIQEKKILRWEIKVERLNQFLEGLVAFVLTKIKVLPNQEFMIDVQWKVQSRWLR